jgi:hypothetical protein
MRIVKGRAAWVPCAGNRTNTMPKNSSAARREAARATAAAEGISYTAALRRLDATREAGSGQLPPDPAGAGVRVIDCGELAARTGCWLADDGCGDLIRNGIWGRASASDLEELGVAEHWDYAAVAAGWTESCRTFLASRGATWDPGADHGEGTLAVPAGRDDEWAEQLWEEAAGRFDAWIEGVVRETLEGRHLAPPGDIRPWTAPGGRWILYVTPDPGSDD